MLEGDYRGSPQLGERSGPATACPPGVAPKQGPTAPAFSLGWRLMVVGRGRVKGKRKIVLVFYEEKGRVKSFGLNKLFTAVP